MSVTIIIARLIRIHFFQQNYSKTDTYLFFSAGAVLESPAGFLRLYLCILQLTEGKQRENIRAKNLNFLFQMVQKEHENVQKLTLGYLFSC